MKRIACIGTGSMGGAIARALCTGGEASHIVISNRTTAHSKALAAELGCEAAEDNRSCAKDADYIFLGVKPHLVVPVLQEISPVLHSSQVVVSMAAGVTGAQMHRIVDNPVVRILPNTPCAIGKGLVLIAPCGMVAKETLAELSAMLAPCGLCAMTDEEHADVGMVIGGCTPAFTAVFMESLADGGVAAGLKREDALHWAAQAVAGSAELLLRSGFHPGQMKDAVCSPGGSTIEGVKALERRAFRASVMEAVEAAVQKTAGWEKSNG